ncbi:steryl-sulfatase-like [Glandiceps talaboti]
MARKMQSLNLILTILSLGTQQCLSDTRKPNFIIILADDLGIGDVGCFGNDTIRTPAIDSLAAEGVKLTHHVAAAATCTPSRAALLTGRYPIRSGMASDIEPGIVTMIPSNDCSAGLPLNETTFAELVKEVGYTTAIIGKWNLGVNLKSSHDHHFYPRNQGFDFFFGIPGTLINECGNNGRNTITRVFPRYYRDCSILLLTYLALVIGAYVMGFMSRRTVFMVCFIIILLSSWSFIRPSLTGRFMCIVILDNDVIEQPIVMDTISERMAKQASGFIERANSDDTPFLLYLSLLQPHTALTNMKNFTGVSRHGAYGDNVEEMDWIIGQLLMTLNKLHLEENTLVYFASDQGGHLEDTIFPGYKGERESGWSGIYKGGKAQNFEGGIRVPGVLRYPPIIAKGIEISVPTSNMDIFPTIAKLAGVDLPNDRVIDGVDLTPWLTGERTAPPHEILFHYCGKWLTAVTYKPNGKDVAVYKVHFVTPNWTPGTECCVEYYLCPCTGKGTTYHDPPLVYNLTDDPSEQRPLPVKDNRIRDVMSRVHATVAKHNQTIVPVPVQISKEKLAGSLWLQPSCNFPFYSCKEED